MTSPVRIEEFFETYVFGWMCQDIQREIDWAKRGESAGNWLCALGLLAYTEAMATILPTAPRLKSASARFNAFFRQLGPAYIDLLDTKRLNVYNIFRNGLAHEYFAKGTCTIAMLDSSPKALEVFGRYTNPANGSSRSQSSFIARPLGCGIGVAGNGSFYLVVERYFADFKVACEKWRVRLLGSPPGISIVPDTPHMSDSNGSPRW
jgi:hypothetical protein